jgi:antitoxin (DNA-binding transcriptional repressor) of toxin-antitoxin stability system
MLYRLHTLDVDNNNEINDEWTTGDILTLPDDYTTDDVAKALIGLERMAEDWPRDDVRLEDDGDEILVCNKEGRKVYKLVPEKDDDADDAPPKCPKCGQEMTDTFCHTGQPRCDECDPECLGCSSGPGPGQDTAQDDEDDELFTEEDDDGEAHAQAESRMNARMWDRIEQQGKLSQWG